MKKVFLGLAVVMYAAPVFAAQTINCEEPKSTNNIKMELEIKLTSKKRGKADYYSVSDFSGPSSSSAEFDVRSINSGVRSGSTTAGRRFTTMFLSSTDGMYENLDVQVQFNTLVVGQEFSDVPAKFVIGLEDGSHSTGLDMICYSRK